MSDIDVATTIVQCLLEIATREEIVSHLEMSFNANFLHTISGLQVNMKKSIEEEEEPTSFWHVSQSYFLLVGLQWLSFR